MMGQYWVTVFLVSPRDTRSVYDNSAHLSRPSNASKRIPHVAPAKQAKVTVWHPNLFTPTISLPLDLCYG